MPKVSKKTKKDESVHSDAEEVVVEREWDDQSDHNVEARRHNRQSITKFDYDDARELDVGDVVKLSNLDMLKILIVRGQDSMNPTLKRGARDLLKTLNGERVGPRRPQFGQRGGMRDGMRDLPRAFAH